MHKKRHRRISTKGWLVSDSLWSKIEPLIPKPKNPDPLGRGRPRACNRKSLSGVLFVLRTGCQWKARVRGLEESWRGERAWLTEQIQERERSATGLRDDLAQLRRSLVEDAARSMREMDSVHQKLTEEFRGLWKSREGGEDSLIQAMEQQSAILRSLAESITAKQQEIEQLQKSLARSSYEVVKAQILEEHQKQLQNLESELTKRLQVEFELRARSIRESEETKRQALEAELRSAGEREKAQVLEAALEALMRRAGSNG